MPNINIKIRNKVAKGEYAVIVCDNSDYIAHFDFDAEWDAYTTKTARFVYGGRYTDVVFSGNECAVPVMQDTRAVTVGVFAGDLHTTTPAYFACVPSILFGGGVPADPTPDVYNQLMEMLNKESGVWYPAVDDAGNMSWTRSISETEPQPVNIKGPKGDVGAQGETGPQGPKGDTGATGPQGPKGDVGADGTNGNDGVSPTVSVAAITGGNRVTITDAEGAKTFDVMDGAQGASGADGKDYVLTDADKQKIAEAAAGLVDVPSVQPDWNQNDSTQPDFVKNRPFYTGDPVETVLVEESTVSFAENSGLYMAQFPSTFEATVGETYKVSWDGTAYECTCVSFNDMPTIGNLSIPGAGSDTGEPFLMGINNGAAIRIIAADTSASHTFSISRIGVPVTKIDEKYLPELPYMDKVNPTGTGAFSLNRRADSAIGNYSFAEGCDTTASGNSSHAEGRNTTASGDYSHAEGYDTTASGNNSHAEGYGTKASSLYQHVHGKYNIEDTSNTYVEIVGNGEEFENSNAHTLDWSGNAWYAGTVEGKALILPSSTAGSTKKFKITVDDSGSITATEVT